MVGTHAGVPWLAGGFIGVDVFFVLSGFLITGKLVQEATTTGQIRLLSFYVRRLRRLLPALLMLLVVGLASTWLLSPFEQSEQLLTAQMAALWLSNFHAYLLNREPLATHRDLARAAGFHERHCLRIESTPESRWLAHRFRKLSKEDRRTSGAYLLHQRTIVAQASHDPI